MDDRRVTIINSTDIGWLDEAHRNGLLTPEADRRCVKVLRECEALRRENAYLQGIIQSQQRTIRSFQQADMAAKRYEFERREGHRMGRGFRIIVGTSLAMFSIAMLTSIFSMVAVWF